MEQYYAMHEVMTRLHLSRDTLTRLIKTGRIPGTIKVGKMFRIPKSGVDRFLAEQAVEPARPFSVPRVRKSTKRAQAPAAGFVPLTMDIFKK